MGFNSITYQKNSDTPDVAFYSVPASNPGDSGGETVIVGSVHYGWNSAEGGFTDTRWWGTEVPEGPTSITGEFENDAAVAEHIRNGGNLNDAFAAWQRYIDGLPVWQESGVISKFNQALAEHGGEGCMSEV